MGAKKKIPSPPSRRRHEVEILGLEIIKENPHQVLGAVLWQDLRHLRDWDDARPYEDGDISVPDSRGALFHANSPTWVLAKRSEAVTLAPELADALALFKALRSAPLKVDERRTADACEEVCKWAQVHKLTETAIQFAEAAAVVDRQSARRAVLAGKLTREAGDFPRAEVWFERGIGLGRRSGSWPEYIRGHLGMGIMFMNLGRVTRARRHFDTASAVAMREGHEKIAAEAQHDLFHFMTIQERYTEGELHARRALAWYPKHHERFPFFVADVAFLFVCRRRFGAAVHLLRGFVRTVKPPHNVLGLSLLVRALASAGQLREFRQRRERLLRLLSTHKEYESAARWNLAEGERAAEMWEAATINAQLALDLANARSDRETAAFAQRLLRELDARVRAPEAIRQTDAASRDLVQTLLGRLAEWSPTRRGRSPSRPKEDWAA